MKAAGKKYEPITYDGAGHGFMRAGEDPSNIVPGNKTAVPTKRLLTLTTCNPKYSARQRLIVHAQLESALLKVNGDPPALTGRG
jgi:sortase (surface protein transpeptidase)